MNKDIKALKAKLRQSLSNKQIELQPGEQRRVDAVAHNTFLRFIVFGLGFFLYGGIFTCCDLEYNPFWAFASNVFYSIGAVLVCSGIIYLMAKKG